MDDVLVIGTGLSGLMAAWTAHEQGYKVRVLAAGIGSTHIVPGWIGIIGGEGALEARLADWIASHPDHPYALAGRQTLERALAALRTVCRESGLNYVGELEGSNFRLPTALGAVASAALVPESFAAGDLRQGGSMLIAGPRRWRDFYPELCAANLRRRGVDARAATFELPELDRGKFDPSAANVARLFDRPEIVDRVAAELKPQIGGAARIGFPAVIGLAQPLQAWHALQSRLGVPVFEIPTLPPSVPGMRLYNAFKRALGRAGVQILHDMHVTGGMSEAGRALAVEVPGAARTSTWRAHSFVLATGGLYGGGISTNHRGEMREVIFDLPLQQPDGMAEWFRNTLLDPDGHPIHRAGVRANRQMQPVNAGGEIVLENVYVAGRLIGGYDPLVEGSAEGVALATGYLAGCAAMSSRAKLESQISEPK